MIFFRKKNGFVFMFVLFSFKNKIATTTFLIFVAVRKQFEKEGHPCAGFF